MYARPANSGPGRTFLMGLPYMLGDKDPKDPIKGWDKTWAYLKELDDGHRILPDRHRRHMKELGEGSRDIIVSTTGWDINPRVLGIVPKEAKIATLKGFHCVADGHYVVHPEGPRPRAHGRAAGRGLLPAATPASRPSPRTRATSIPARP